MNEYLLEGLAQRRVRWDGERGYVRPHLDDEPAGRRGGQHPRRRSHGQVKCFQLFIFLCLPLCIESKIFLLICMILQ